MTQAFNLSQLANFVNSSGQLDASTGLTNTTSLGFPSGTLMLFQQTTAPTGWTKQTTHNDKILRVVSGTASSGGSTSFSTVFSNQTPIITTSGLATGATTLSTSQIPSHGHNVFTKSNYGATPYNVQTSEGGGVDVGYSGAVNITGGGSGGSHSHTVTGTATSSAIVLNVQYVDLIIAQKN